MLEGESERGRGVGIIIETTKPPHPRTQPQLPARAPTHGLPPGTGSSTVLLFGRWRAMLTMPEHRGDCQDACLTQNSVRETIRDTAVPSACTLGIGGLSTRGPVARPVTSEPHPCAATWQ